MAYGSKVAALKARFFEQCGGKNWFKFLGLWIVLIAPPTMALANTPLDLEQELAAQIELLQAQNSDTPGFAIAVISNGRVASSASGIAAPDQTPMTAKTPFRLASVTKTFVAAAILRLCEQGLLNIDSPIEELILQEHRILLQRDGYDTKAITVRHLLMHASGMNDHFGTAKMRELVFSNPRKIWTRTEQLALMIQATDPLGKPGERFAYSDTGYLLLGEIVERITGEALGNTLGRAVADLNRFEELGLGSMVWEGQGAHPNSPDRAHQWINGFDTYDLHGSVDAFGGGGLIGDVRQIAIYFDALFGGRVFDDGASLELMKTAQGHPASSPYRIGLFKQVIGSNEVFMHGGFWGVQAIHVPELDLTIATVALAQSGDHAIKALAYDIIRAQDGSSGQAF